MEVHISFSEQTILEDFNKLLKLKIDLRTGMPRIPKGADRIEFEHFDRDKHLHIPAVSRKLLNGSYIFSPFLERQIPKPGGNEFRTISISSLRDTIAQRAIYRHLYPLIENRLTPAVFSYRKGIGSHNAIQEIVSSFSNGFVYVFESDICKFFDKIDHDLLLSKLVGLGLDDNMVRLVRRFIKTSRIESHSCDIDRKSVGKMKKLEATKRTIGVPQGGVLSGLLANFYLADFDQRLSSVHWKYIRYADDFVVCCKSTVDCNIVSELACTCLNDLKLELHASPKKTKIGVHSSEGIDFLGFHVKDSNVKIKRANVVKFNNRINAIISSHNFTANASKSMKRLINRINRKIVGGASFSRDNYCDEMNCNRRSWIGYFRIANSIGQLNSIDNWIRSCISQACWDNYKKKLKYTKMRKMGLKTIVNSFWKSKKGIVKARVSVKI